MKYSYKIVVCIVLLSVIMGISLKVGQNYLGKTQTKDPYYDLIMDPSLQKNVYPERKMQNIQEQTGSLMGKHMNKQLFNKLKDLKTKSGWTIARAINTGVMNPESFVGCHAGDKESYSLFNAFYNPLIEDYHVGFKTDGSMHHVTDLDESKITKKLSKSAQSKIFSTRIRVARNLVMFPLNPSGTRQSRENIADLIEFATKKFPAEFQGKFYRHTEMTDEERQQLIDDHFLFKGGDKMQAASGYHQYWPHGRAIFLSNDKKFVLWINEGDHLRIISLEQGGDIHSVFRRLSKGVQLLEDALKQITGKDEIFATSDILGQITACPSNLGTGMRGSVHMAVPKLIESKGQDQLNLMARKLECQVRGSSGEHSQVIDRIDVSNWRRLGFREWELVQDMIGAVNMLSDLEDQL